MGDRLLADYGTYLRSMAYSESTIRQRLRLLRHLEVDPRHATPQDVQRVISRPDGVSARRVYLTHLRSAYADFAFMGWCDRDPTLGLRTAKAPPPPPHPLTDDQVATLRSLGTKEAAWTILGCYAGLRAGEVNALPADAFDGTHLTITGKGNKTARVAAHPLVVEVMADWTPPLYCHAGALSARWRLVGARAGVLKVRFHSCRHWYGTTLLRATGDLMLVRDAMRHASVSTTQRYLAVANDRVDDAVRALAA